MEKAVFKSVLESIVEGFENPDFKAKMAAAKAAGDLRQLVGLPLEIQQAAFAKGGLDPIFGTPSFKDAGRAFGLDPDVAPLFQRMKAALA